MYPLPRRHHEPGWKGKLRNQTGPCTKTFKRATATNQEILMPQGTSKVEANQEMRSFYQEILVPQGTSKVETNQKVSEGQEIIVSQGASEIEADQEVPTFDQELSKRPSIEASEIGIKIHQVKVEG